MIILLERLLKYKRASNHDLDIKNAFGGNWGSIWKSVSCKTDSRKSLGKAPLYLNLVTLRFNGTDDMLQFIDVLGVSFLYIDASEV